MPHSRLACDVDATEEAELERLEHGRNAATGNAHGSTPYAAGCTRGQAVDGAAGATSTVQGNAVQGGAGQMPEARQTLVTAYAEHRASLSEKKKYRRAIKIDLKLPEGIIDVELLN